MMRKNRKKHNKNVHYDWDDRPDDPEKTLLIICSGMAMIDYICDKFELSKYILEDMEKRMEMTWGEWQIQQDRNMSWHSELDWWGDPMHCKLTYEDLDFLEYHESEWVHYIHKSRQRELDSQYRKISVIGKYCSNGYRLLICDKFPSCIATQYIHTGDKAYMSLDGEHHH